MSPNRQPKKHTGIIVVLILVILALIAGTAFMIKMSLDLAHKETETRPSESISLPTPDTTGTTSDATETTGEPTETDPPNMEHVVSTATIGAVGDLLMHKQLFQEASNSITYQSDGTYDFSAIFQYIKSYTNAYDYAVANLETTLSGDDYPYQGNPRFNCPDALLDSVIDSGFDMLLTANNHIYDNEMDGLTRTMEVVRESGLETLGTRLTEDEPRYSVIDVNGIRIGMVCYTFTTSMSGSQPRLNGNNPVKQPELVNFFTTNKLNDFYSEIESVYAEMEAAGAEATVLYIHWGTEYELTQNTTQENIAQKMCNIGFDVIVGGHPHVVQSMDLLESTEDPDHKTVCIYSLGNVVSNQRRNEMRLRTGHTEDGVLLTFTFEKYSDGKVYLAETDVIPTWTNMHSNNGGLEYNILPLDDSKVDQWAEMFSIDDATLTLAKDSYDRTMKIVGEGLTECQDYLAQQQASREEHYYNMALYPELYATEATDATETAEETTEEPA